MTLSLVPPVQTVSCADCVNATFSSAGVYCTEFNEWILNESVANDCGLFETEHRMEHPVHQPALVVKDNQGIEPDADLVADCEKYLNTLHCALWGQFFALDRTRRTADAARWLAAQITQLEAFRSKREESNAAESV